MTDLIQRQLWCIFIMVQGGMAVMMIFEIRNSIIGKIRGNKKIQFLIYFLSWPCAAYLFCRFLYKSSNGDVTLYGIISAIAGIILWKKFIYGIIDKGKYNNEKEKENQG